MKVLFVNDWKSNPNWGDRGAAFSLAVMVQEQGGTIVRSLSEDALYRAALDEDAPGFDGGGKAGARQIAKLLAPPGLVAVGRRVLAGDGETRESRLIPRKWADYAAARERMLGSKTAWPGLARVLPDVDVAVIHGAGAVYGSNRLAHTMLFLGFVIKSGFDKPVVLVNHSAHFDRPDLLEIARQVYPLFDDVVFRDNTSLEQCKTFCTARFAADTAFAFEPAPREVWTAVAKRPGYFDVWPDSAPFDPSSPYVCVGGSSIFGHEGERGAVVKGYRELLARLRSVYSGQLVLTASDLVDEGILRPLARELSLSLIGLNTPVQQAVDILGNADAYIGGRWHPAIFALTGGTPLIPLSSKTFKMKALVEMAGLSTVTFDALDLERQAAAIGRELLSSLERGSELRARLRAWAGEMAASSRGNLAFLERMQAGRQGPRTERRPG